MVKRKSSYFLRGEVFFNLTRSLMGDPFLQQGNFTKIKFQI